MHGVSLSGNLRTRVPMYVNERCRTTASVLSYHYVAVNPPNHMLYIKGLRLLSVDFLDTI